MEGKRMGGEKEAVNSLTPNKLLQRYIGKKIKEFTWDQERIKIAFSDEDVLRLWAQGECCSRSWFECPTGEESLEPGATLLKIHLVDGVLPPKWGDDDKRTLFYSVKILTDKGYCDIEMRNLSNGYYGGYITINSPGQYGKAMR